MEEALFSRREIYTLPFFCSRPCTSNLIQNLLKCIITKALFFHVYKLNWKVINFYAC